MIPLLEAFYFTILNFYPMFEGNPFNENFSELFSNETIPSSNYKNFSG